MGRFSHLFLSKFYAYRVSESFHTSGHACMHTCTSMALSKQHHHHIATGPHAMDGIFYLFISKFYAYREKRHRASTQVVMHACMHTCTSTALLGGDYGIFFLYVCMRQSILPFERHHHHIATRDGWDFFFFLTLYKPQDPNLGTFYFLHDFNLGTFGHDHCTALPCSSFFF